MSTDPLTIENADVKRTRESLGTICPACGSTDIRLLPELAGKSMLSDGRFVPLALRRHACCACGLAAHAAPPSAETTRTFFASGYDLYAHPAGNKFEQDRQRRYAAWISCLGDSSRPETVFEIGCGNGSLLMALRSIWPSASFAGLEPAAVAANHARQAGFAVAQGFLESSTGPENAADLVLSVNVMEHTSDPARFLRYFRDRMTASGRGIIICPDGDLPSSELLIFDHLHSFTGAALSRFIVAAGLKLIRQAKAPAGLAGFQAAVVERDGPVDPITAGGPESALALFDARSRFLLTWQRLDGLLTARAADAAELVCFGTGECAQLLRAYAPRLWTKVVAFTVDAGAGFFDGRPVLDYAALGPAPGRIILPAVRQDLHSAIYQRLRIDGHEFVAWNDLLPA